jgi:selenocysteine-specific elongation factor
MISLPNGMKKIEKFVMDINKVRLYKRPIKNKMKFHMISGHQTVMGELRLFYSPDKKLNLDM